MAYAASTPELRAIEGDEDLVTEALNVASGLIDQYLALYVTPVTFSSFVASDTKTYLQARFTRWCLSIAAHVLTANRPGQSEKVVKDYEATIAELREVRAGFMCLPLLTRLEAPILARAW